MTQEQENMLQDAMDNPHLLNEWEQQFVRSLFNKPIGYELSDKQSGTLRRIARKLQWD